jgi:hypothetical protein
MSERKMAYIATVSKVEDISGKDKIAYASLRDLGWQVIVDKSIKENDRVIYVEIDSILPVKEEYEFLRKRCYYPWANGFLIKGMRMAGLVSYGLILPLPEKYAAKPDGYDMTKILVIRKTEEDKPHFDIDKSIFKRFIKYLLYKLVFRKGKRAYENLIKWPSFIPKTDEVRVENIPYVFNPENKIIGSPVYTTVKVDGQSATFAIHKGYFYVASRNIILYCDKIKKAIKYLNSTKEDKLQNNFLKIACRYNIPVILQDEGEIILQGELAGPGICKNPLDLSSIELYIFNVYSIKRKAYCSWDKIKYFCDKYELKTVPFIEKRIFNWPDKKALKEYAKGQYPNGKAREGVVIRYDNNDNDIPNGLRGMCNMWSFKCINDDYIL